MLTGLAALALAASLLLAPASPAGADPARIAGLATAADLQALAARGTVRLGFHPSAAPFSSKAEGGAPDGYSVALCREVVTAAEALLGGELEVVYVPVLSETRFAQLNAAPDDPKRVDILCESTTLTLARRFARAEFSLPTFLTGGSVLYRVSTGSRFADLDGHGIGVVRGTTADTQLSALIADSALDIDIDRFATSEEGVAALRAGAIEALFDDHALLTRLADDLELGGEFAVSARLLSYEPYALAVPQGAHGLRHLVDVTLVELYRSRRIDALIERYFDERTVPPLLDDAFTVLALPVD